MPDPWRLILEPNPARGAWNMAVDEAILESIGRGDSLPTLRLYAWHPACLSLGLAQSISDVDQIRLKDRGWELVRRPTGGRAVLHADELTYSVIGPGDEPRLSGTVLECYNRLAKALLSALRLLELPAWMQENVIQTDRNLNPVCFEIPSTYEITVDGKKLLGSAQARRRDGVLQHGSLPLVGDLTRILQVLAFPDEDARASAIQRLLTRAATVEMILGRKITWEQASSAFISAFNHILDIELQPGFLTSWEWTRAGELRDSKYAAIEWTENKQ